jgi:hypothetical protein
MRLWSKRGTDKPIEIFIALFVILAVAMVILKMFSSQIEEKRKEMETQQQEERARMAQADLDTFCATKCSNAFKSLKDKVTFCTSYYQGEIDINKNSMPDYTMLIDNIQGYCEDRIYCSAYKPCGSLDVLTCKKIVCDYMDRQMEVSGDEAQANRMVGYDTTKGQYKAGALFNPGECWNRLSDEEKKMHWFYTFMAVPDINNVDTSGNFLGGKCFFTAGTCLETYQEINDAFSAWSFDDWAGSCPVYE